MKREKKRSKRDMLNRNAAFNTFSNFLLATSLALTGTAFTQAMSESPRFEYLEIAICLFSGLIILTCAVGVHYFKEDPDDVDSDVTNE